MDVSVNALKTAAERKFADLYAAEEDRLPGAGEPWVEQLRSDALAAYGTLGLPHRRIEAWKYTDLRARLTEVHPPAKPLGRPVDKAEIVTALGAAVAELDVFRLVFVEGELRPGLSDLEALAHAGVETVSLTEALVQPSEWLKQALGKTNPPEDNPVLALNTALMSFGSVIRIPDGVVLEKPIHLIHLDGSGEAVGSIGRHVIAVGAGSKATILESYGSLGGRGVQRNIATELVVGDRAEISHVKIEREGLDATHLAIWMAVIGKSAIYRPAFVSMGAGLARTELHARFAGEGSSVDFAGLSLLRGKQHCDTTLVIDHAVPRCSSRELFKGVLDGESRAVFQGKLIVRPDAQKTDAKQMAQALLLSEGAEFDSKPELEIFADDVACGHGSTAGEIDEDLLFYLRARGLPEPQARALLVQAFVGEALSHITDESVQAALRTMAAEWLGLDP